MKTAAKSIFFALTLTFSILASSAFALDSTQAVRTNVTPKSTVPTGTVATWPMDAAVPPGWLACNGQAVPAVYPELRALMASVPNYNNSQFLRGSTSGAGRAVADSTRSHAHAVPAHSHTVSGSASSQTVGVGSQTVTGTAGAQSVSVGPQSITGTAEGQRSNAPHTWLNDTGIGDPPGYAGSINYTYGDSVFHSGTYQVAVYASSSSISGKTSGGTYNTGGGTISGKTSGGTYSTSGGTITGVTNSVSNTTDANGGSETAPQHVLVKFIIKAD